MGWTRKAVFLLAGLAVIACGQGVRPVAQSSPIASPTSTPSQQPDPTPAPMQDGITAWVTCAGKAGAVMAVVAGAIVYDVADPLRPRLVYRRLNTLIHPLDGHAIACTPDVA